jgi:serine/threonine protein kinase/Tol biopolymer transport system component
MGEVYKALDIRLDRVVALKVLTPTLVSDPDRVGRFVGEAKSASALNHPHIITIYDIGLASPDATGEDSSSSAYYIAMEFVDGGTLQSAIHRDRTDLKKLLEYFAQTAEGLAKAHTAGIIHRDLKPENVMITTDGYAKILDFGLAKLIEPAAGTGFSSEDLREAPTAMMARTQPGMVMGTVGYMSPEQAQGKPVDHRSDIFSFGCMLYEAATLQRPFQGDSMIDSLHKIVYAQPAPVRDSNPNAPAELQRIIRKCLAKDPGERYQSIKDIAIDLRDLIREYDSLPPVSVVFVPSVAAEGHFQRQVTGVHTQPPIGGPPLPDSGSYQSLQSGAVEPVAGSPRSGAFRWIAISGGLVALAAIAIVTLFLLFGQKQKKLGGPAFESTRITKLTTTGQSLNAVMSPDGKLVAHLVREAGKVGMWVRQTETPSNVQILPPDDSQFVGMTFSRDGNYIYFTKGEKGATVRNLFQIPTLGGNAKKLIEDVDSPVSFSPDGRRFAFIRHAKEDSALIIANADGSNEQRLTALTQPDAFLDPAWSPDGKVIACPARRITGGYRFELIAVDAADGSTRVLGDQKWLAILDAAWLAGSNALVLNARDQTPGARLQIWEITYPDGKTRRITNDLNDYAGVSASADSSALVTVQTETVANVFVAPGGDESRGRQVTQGSGHYDQVSWMPDGRILYVSDVSSNADIWVMDADGKNQKQLTVDSGVNTFPAASPDGSFVVFNSNRGKGLTSFTIWRMGTDGGNARQLTNGDGDFFPACSGDSKWVLFTPFFSGTTPALHRVSIDGGEQVLVVSKHSLRPAVSPDGKFIACQYNDGPVTTPPVVAIIPFEGGDPVSKLSIPLTQYRWSADAKSILYLDSKEGVGNVWSQPVAGGAPRQVTRFTTGQIFSFDWSRDGRQLLCTRGHQTNDVLLIRDLNRGGTP